MLAMTS